MQTFTTQPSGWTYTPADNPTTKELFKQLCLDFKSDPWGYGMSLAFDVAGECYRRDLENVLGYCPGCFGPEDIEDSNVRNLLESLTDPALLELARFINRVLEALKRAGRDY